LAKTFLRVGEAARTILEAVALGCLRTEDLTQLANEVYTRDVQTANPGYLAEMGIRPIEQDIIPMLGEWTSGRRLLDVFCGAGREAELFSQHGFLVTGIDSNPAMIAEAGRYCTAHGLQVRFVQADFTTFQTDAHWDLVYFSPFMYQAFCGRRKRIELLRKAGQFLAEGGVLLFAIIPPTEPTVGSRFYHGIARLTTCLSGSDLELERTDRLTYGGFRHFFRPAEVEREVAEAGYVLVDSRLTSCRTHYFLVLRKGAESPRGTPAPSPALTRPQPVS
jgi:SAM-dependent methyltransferase